MMDTQSRAGSSQLPPRSSGLGRPRGVALYLASLLGAGLLALPALAYRAGGPGSLLSWAALLAMSVPVALTFAALGRDRPDSGGVSAHVGAAFGDAAGAASAFCFILALPFGAPAGALVGAAYVARAAGWGEHGILPVAAAILLLAVRGAVAGATVAGGVQVVLAAALVAILVVASLGALPHASLHAPTPWMPHGAMGLGRAAGVLFFSFAGWEAVTPLAQEFRHPRTDTRAVAIWTLALVTVLYLALAAACVFGLGDALLTDQAPVETLLTWVVPRWAGWLSAAVAAILVHGTMTAYLGGAASMASALARDGWLPASLARGHERGRVPRRAAAAIGAVALASLLVLYGLGLGLTPVMTAASAMFVAVTLMGLVAGARLLSRRRERVWALAGAAAMALVLVSCGWVALCPVLVMVLTGVAARHGRRPVR